MSLFDTIDPFFLQLVTVPLVTIGLGLAAALVTKRLVMALLLTLLANVIYEAVYMYAYYGELTFSFSSWVIVLPVVSLLLAWLVRAMGKNEKTFQRTATYKK